MATPPNSNDHTIKVLQSELEYRRSKQGSIFTWSSAILVAIAGSPLALGTTLQHRQKIFVSVAVIGLALMAFLWLTYNANRESRTSDSRHLSSSCVFRCRWPRYSRTVGRTIGIVHTCETLRQIGCLTSNGICDPVLP